MLGLGLDVLPRLTRRPRLRRRTFRTTVVLITTPDNLRGRAQAGHVLAANVANALGQVNK